MDNTDIELNSKVLVTGASGHLGFALTKLLVEKGYKVRVGVRDLTNEDKVEWLKDLGVEIVSLDISNLDQFEKAANDMDAIFHVAAVFKFGLPNPEETIIKPTVEGALNSIRAAKSQNVKRVILTSSGVTLGDAENENQPLNENNWNQTTQIPYQIAKTRAEKEAWKLSKELDVDLVTILPGFILGPYFKHLSSSIKVINDIIKKKIPMIPPFGFVVADVRDVANAHIEAFERPEAIGRYVVSIGTPNSLEDFFNILHDIDPTIKVPRFKINRFMFITYARFTSFFARLFGKIPQITTQQAKEYTSRVSMYDISKTKNELGISPRPLEETLRDTFDWFKKQYSTGILELNPNLSQAITPINS